MNLKEAVEEIDSWLRKYEWIQSDPPLPPVNAIETVNDAVKEVFKMVDERKMHEEVAERLYEFKRNGNPKMASWEQLTKEQKKPSIDNCEQIYEEYEKEGAFLEIDLTLEEEEPTL